MFNAKKKYDLERRLRFVSKGGAEMRRSFDSLQSSAPFLLDELNCCVLLVLICFWQWILEAYVSEFAKKTGTKFTDLPKKSAHISIDSHNSPELSLFCPTVII